jgi:hypothetical protein
MIASLLLRYAPHAALALGVALLAVFTVHTLREQGRNEIRPQVERLETALAAEKADRARAERASDAYQSEMALLRSRADSRAAARSPVRLCLDAPAVPASGQAAQRTDGAATETRRDDRPTGGDLEAGPDIGAELYALAAVCDAEIAKLRALQGWTNGLD